MGKDMMNTTGRAEERKRRGRRHCRVEQRWRTKIRALLWNIHLLSAIKMSLLEKQQQKHNNNPVFISDAEEKKMSRFLLFARTMMSLFISSNLATWQWILPEPLGLHPVSQCCAIVGKGSLGGMGVLLTCRGRSKKKRKRNVETNASLSVVPS